MSLNAVAMEAKEEVVAVELKAQVQQQEGTKQVQERHPRQKEPEKDKEGGQTTLLSAIQRSFGQHGLKPRPHQVLTIGNILQDLTSERRRDDRKAHNYLIQHAAGSGKSLTISCLVLCLHQLRFASAQHGFDLILVLNDRIVLDTQLSQTLKSFLGSADVDCAQWTQSSSDLAVALRSKNIVISTVQKVTTLIKREKKGLVSASSWTSIVKGRRVAIIADEAHRSHGSQTSTALHQLLSGKSHQGRTLTYFSFTCTPSETTLQLFGKNGAPFYSYGTADAVQDGVILDVLKNYKFIDESAYKELDTEEIAQKAKFIAKDLQQKFTLLSSEFPQATAMLVVRSRPAILQYMATFKELQREFIPGRKKSSFPITFACAFTPMERDGVLLTSKEVNSHLPEDMDVVENFKRGRSIRLMIVAEMLQTGFDSQPLSIMYVDKPLTGANFVQTLGRVSRVSPRKSEVFVVDFHNEKSDAIAAYTSFEYQNDKQVIAGVKQFLNEPPSNLIVASLCQNLLGIKYSAASRNYYIEKRREMKLKKRNRLAAPVRGIHGKRVRNFLDDDSDSSEDEDGDGDGDDRATLSPPSSASSTSLSSNPGAEPAKIGAVPPPSVPSSTLLPSTDGPTPPTTRPGSSIPARPKFQPRSTSARGRVKSAALASRMTRAKRPPSFAPSASARKLRRTPSFAPRKPTPASKLNTVTTAPNIKTAGALASAPDSDTAGVLKRPREGSASEGDSDLNVKRQKLALS